MKLDSKQKKFLLIGGGVVLVVYLISKWLHSRPKPLPVELQSDNLDKTKVLKKGTQGVEVAELQRVLKKDYNAELGSTGVNKDGIDGDFGTLTEIALKEAKGVSEITLNNL
jgi:hypothetical protein